MFLGGRSFELEHDGYRYPEGSCAVLYQGGFVIIGGFESRKVERWVLQEILNFFYIVGVRYETNGHYLGSLPDLIGHTGMQYHACTSFVSAQGEQVDFQELSKSTFLENRACWPLEVIAILQTISRLLNCIYRQPISGQMEENYQGNNKPHEIST